MFKEVMSQNTIVDLPLLALGLFIVVFAIVIARVITRGKHDPKHAYLAQLPLEDDTQPRAAVAPERGAARRGAPTARGDAHHG